MTSQEQHERADYEDSLKGIITTSERKELINRITNLRGTDGIRNQILHLEIPDDNENYESVFYFLEDHILLRIAEWTKILRELHKFKRRMW